MRYWKTCYITCFIFVLIPLTLYGQEDVEQLQKLDKLMFSGRCFESKELHKKISDTTTIPSDLELYYKFRMAQFLYLTIMQLLGRKHLFFILICLMRTSN